MEKLEVVQKEFEPFLLNINDITGGVEPKSFFYFMVKNFGYLLDPKNEEILSVESIKKRRIFYKLIKTVGPLFLMNKQVFENRHNLLNPHDFTEDCGIDLPKEPVIWVSNHAFKDDTLASILAIYRHAYILFGSLPQFYNTFDGLLSYLNGVVLTNRKVKESRNYSVHNACVALNNGVDLLMFPEGVWNKSPNELILNLWPGVYRIAKESGARVVPVAHYLSDLSAKDKSQMIHTVVDNPIDIASMTEKEALSTIRDILATWHYLMMERYGKTTRDELLQGKTPTEVWEQMLVDRIATAGRYDLEIETTADYRHRSIVRPEDVFGPIANIQNVTALNIQDVEHAKKLVKCLSNNDFQRRF